MDKPQELQLEELNQREVHALKALSAGEADEYQQRLALQIIVNKFSRAQDLLYIPGGDTHGTAFLNGRAFVGTQILKHLNMPVRYLVSQQSTGDDDDSSRSER